MTTTTSAARTTGSLEEKLAHLNEILRSLDRALIGYSGGVDSAFLALAAHRVLGDNAIAVTADSESYASGELEMARDIARQFGIRHEVVQTRELENPDYAKNPTNRCYFCKQELFAHMRRLAEELDVSAILYGQNVDDVGDFRPGSQAARESGARAPLQEAGLTKQDIRELSRQWGLPVWNRPATACLASRFPYGTPVTAAGLHMVDQAEKFLRGRGFVQLRVRHHTNIARIELPADDLPRLLGDAGLCQSLVCAFTDLGYEQTTADLRGFRSGSMNEVLVPAPAHPDEVPARIQAALAALGPFRGEFAEYDQMICLRLEEQAREGLQDPERRSQLVQHLENLGFRYVALDLNPLA